MFLRNIVTTGKYRYAHVFVPHLHPTRLHLLPAVIWAGRLSSSLPVLGFRLTGWGELNSWAPCLRGCLMELEVAEVTREIGGPRGAF